MTVTTLVKVAEQLCFGPFYLNSSTRELIKDRQPVSLGSRAFDILLLLAVNAGKVLDKNTLIAAAWPDTVVEESNLRVHISAIRKALEDECAGRYIENVPGRGYCFVAEVSFAPVRLENTTVCDANALPQTVPNVIGREFEIAEISRLLSLNHLVTISGPGGIGKTSVALAYAHSHASCYPGGGYFVDIAQINHAELIATSIASAMRIAASEHDAISGVIAAVKQPVLLLLDNCERMVDTVGEIVERILAGTDAVHVLVTSREPLRASGELSYPLKPLCCPPLEHKLTADSLTLYSAAHLFIHCVKAHQPDIKIDVADGRTIAQICRRLDGVPLALELAAARIKLFGFKELEARLDDRFNLLTKGRRTALPRHQTLRAVIDWSYETLSETEASIWRQLAIFAGPFSLSAALAILQDETLSEHGILDVLDTLVAKSLIAVRCQHGHVMFFLLESMRYFALELLNQHDVVSNCYRRYANYCLEYVLTPGNEWEAEPAQGRVKKRQNHINDIRQALNWAFSAEGDRLLAIRLTVESAPLWFKSLLLPEIRLYLEKARSALSEFEQRITPDSAARLYLALGHAIFHTQGPGSKVQQALQAGLVFAQQLEDVTLKLRLIWSLYAHAVVCGHYAEVTSWTRCYGEAAIKSEDATADATYLRALTIDYHLRGEHTKALQCGEQALHHPAIRNNRNADVFVYDHRVATSAHYARALWLSGQPQIALEICKEYLPLALQVKQPFALGYFLVCGACPVALWSGDLKLARYYVDMLRELVSGLSEHVWRPAGQFLHTAVRLLGDAEQPVADCDAGTNRFYADTLSTFHWRLLSSESLQRVERGENVWCSAEVLRAAGESVLASSTNQLALAQDYFVRAYQLAEQTKALAWQLRAAISLVKSEYPGADKLLQHTYQQFRQGHGTADLSAAAALLG